MRSCESSDLPTERLPRRGNKERSDVCACPMNILILGASYGSLFSTKVLMAGHRVTLVCTRPTAELINREGTLVRFPIKGREELLDIASKTLPGSLAATTPDEVDPS